MGVTITIDHPATGSGATWDCSTVDGSTTGCALGSTVSTGEFQKVGMNWSLLNSRLTATDAAGDWVATTSGPTYTAAGDYKIVAEVMDNATFAKATDTNTWTIP